MFTATNIPDVWYSELKFETKVFGLLRDSGGSLALGVHTTYVCSVPQPNPPQREWLSFCCLQINLHDLNLRNACRLGFLSRDLQVR